MNKFKLQINDIGDYSFQGVINKKTVTNIWRERHLMSAKNDNIVIDLTRITASDSAGLALLICLQKEAIKSKYKLLYTNPPSQLQQLIELSHLQHILNAEQGL